jgi:hypothetical protein
MDDWMVAWKGMQWVEKRAVQKVDQRACQRVDSMVA